MRATQCQQWRLPTREARVVDAELHVLCEIFAGHGATELSQGMISLGEQEHANGWKRMRHQIILLFLVSVRVERQHQVGLIIVESLLDAREALNPRLYSRR